MSDCGCDQGAGEIFTSLKEERRCFLVVGFILIGRATVQPDVVFSILKYVTYLQAAVTALLISMRHMRNESVRSFGIDNSGR